MNRHNLEIYFHMKNHYKKLEAVKCVVDTGRSRLEQHHLRNAVLKNLRKKNRAHFCKLKTARTVSDDRPQTRRNLSDVPSSQQTRSQSTKRSSFKSDKKKNKQLANQIEPAVPPQKDLGERESDSLNNTKADKSGKERTKPVPEKAPLALPKTDVHDVIVEETSSNVTTCMERVEEDETCVENATKCINEHEYSQFLLRITEDIIRNECYTMEMILNVFKSHIEANKSHLDLDKMLLMIKQLCSEINFPIEIKEIQETDENEQCKICFDYCDDMNYAAEEPYQQKEFIFDMCKSNDTFPPSKGEFDTVEENSPDESFDNSQARSIKCSLSEKLQRCLEQDEEILPKMKNEPEEIDPCLKYRKAENCDENMTGDIIKDKTECKPEQKWNNEENALPIHYVNQLENCLQRMETFFTHFNQANVCQRQTPANCDVPQAPLRYPKKCIKNNLHEREHHETCNATRSQNKHYCVHCQRRFRQKPGNKNELPTTYPFGLSYECNKTNVKNDIEPKEVTLCNLSPAYACDIDCNEYAEEVAEKLSCDDMNSVYTSSFRKPTTCDLASNTDYRQCKGMEIQTENIDETKTTIKEKNQVQQRAVGVQWGKCCCLNSKGNQTTGCCVNKECLTSKIVPKSIDASTQYAKTDRGCPSSSEYYKKKKSAKSFPQKVDACVQYEIDKCKKSTTDVAKTDTVENLNSCKDKFKICIQPSENNSSCWNSKIVEYKLLLQDLFLKCENQCAANYGNLPQKDVKQNVETNFSGCKKTCEKGTIPDKGCYKIDEYKSMLQDLFQKCNEITQDNAPMGNVHQTSNSTPKLLLDNYAIKACQKDTAPSRSYCPKDEIFISPAYENWSVCKKDVKFSREVAHQFPQIQDDFHVTVMHDAFTCMPHKHLLSSTYCNPANRICDKRENYLLDSTYAKNKHKEHEILPLTLASFFPNAETQTTDIDRHIASQLIISLQTPTKEEIPTRRNSSVPQTLTEDSPQNVLEEDEEEEELSKKYEVQEEQTSRTPKRGSLKPEHKDRRKNLIQPNKMVSVGQIEELPFTFENDIKGYQSGPLPVNSNPENSAQEESQGANPFEGIKENNDGSGEIEIENNEVTIEEINEPESSELLEVRGGESRKGSGGSRSKEIEQTEKPSDEDIPSDESDYNCCGRKKMNSSDMSSRNDRLSTRASTYATDKQSQLLSEANTGHKISEVQQMTRDENKLEEMLKKSDKRFADKNIDLEQIKKRFDRRSSSLNSDELRIEQTVRKTLGGKERTRAKSHYIDEENLEVFRTRSKKRNTLMVLQDQVSNDS